MQESRGRLATKPLSYRTLDQNQNLCVRQSISIKNANRTKPSRYFVGGTLIFKVARGFSFILVVESCAPVRCSVSCGFVAVQMIVTGIVWAVEVETISLLIINNDSNFGQKHR